MEPTTHRELPDNTVSAVTGADGFIGSHVVEALVRRGVHVKAMTQYNSFGAFGWLDTLSKEVLADVEIHPGDIRDRGSVQRLLEGAATVYHLAALIAIPYSYVAPQSYVDTNVTGTLNVLEAARALQPRRVVNVSTSEVYGSAQSLPITESHPLQAQSPYAATKIAAEHLAASFHHSFGLPVVTVRLFNTFGPRQSVRAVIPAVITQIALASGRVMVGSLAPTRDFVYVADTVRAILAAGTVSASAHGETFNVGTGVETSIRALVTIIADAMGKRIDVEQVDDRMRPPTSEVDRLVGDAAKLYEHTGWRPIFSLRQGLDSTIAWFQNSGNLARYAPDRIL
jgi:NAD dependent epimerase/dehydratase